ncbi:hypothetical protein JIN84_20920 [Luteolibacter yonseiensis]|uniref:Translation initiation factor IF-2 n=1 Tax=Luteolibacter yonseiensis TaxID=1144680 RepID=A0A934R8Y5_9BACT|nr:hypothetical protein [Luteolibacter yonseiensis]MBK1818098.1 hypothetical protein [Luteolibacter yonseiensis]
MNKNFRSLAGAALAALTALASTSCYYDPYATTTVGGSYSSGGYGDGYGYGGSSFSTSVFVSTGDPRWGYDPYCYSYYDYSRRCYYDPYLNGYYPVGYRPPVVYGVPHPGGWRPGHGYCPPPRYVSHGYISDYRNREGRYRNSNYKWAREVRQAPQGGRVQGSRPPQGGFQRNDSPRNGSRPDNFNRPSNNFFERPSGSGSRPSTNDSRPSGGYSRDRQPSSQNGRESRESYRPQSGNRESNRPQSGNRPPERFNSPVTNPSQRQSYQGQRPQQGQRAVPQNFGNQRPQPQRQQQPQAGRGSGGKKQPRQEEGRVQGYR